MKIKVTILLSLMTAHALAYSAQNGFEVMSFRPATDDSRYLSIYDSQILEKGEWFLGTTFDYSFRPLQVTKEGTRQHSVLDKVFEQHIYSSVGIITDSLELGIDIPIGWMLNFRAPNAATSTTDNKTALGDVIINAKVSLLDGKTTGIGLSIRPFVSLPTGKSDYFFGNGVFSAGADLITEINPFEKLFIGINLGILGKKNYVFNDINDGSKLTGGIAVGVAATKKLDIYTDLLFKTRLSGIFREKSETPVELLTGVKYKIGETGLVINGAVGGGLINGAGAPQYRIIFGLGYYIFGHRTDRKASDRKHQGTPDVKMIYFDFNSARIKSGTKELDGLADEMQKDPAKNIIIEGNADNIGPVTANERISMRRAEAVSSYLSERSVERSRMELIANGSRNPVADNITKQGRRANRRVEVIVRENLK